MIPRAHSGALPLVLAIASALATLHCSPGAQRPADAVVPGPELVEMEPRVARVLQEARQAVLASRDSAEAWGELGSLYDAHMLTDLAETCYRRAGTLAPDDFRWVYLLAIVREIQGADAPELRQRFGRASAIRPEYAPLHVRLGDALWRRGEYEEARDQLRRAIELSPEIAMAHRRLGQVLLALGQAQEAAEQLGQAVTLEPGDLAARSALAQALMRLGRTEEAREARDGARGLEPVSVLNDPVYGAQVFMRSMNSGRAFARATAAIRAGAYDRAVEDLRLVLEVRPDDASVHYWTGTAYQQLGDIRLATTHLTRAVKLAPGMVQARLQLGQLLVLHGRHAEALEQYQRAGSLRPLDADGHYGLGLAYAGLGREAQAQKQFRAATRLDPGHLASSRIESHSTGSGAVVDESSSQ